MINKSALIKVIIIGLAVAAILQVIGAQLAAASDSTSDATNPYSSMLAGLAVLSIVASLVFGALYGFFDQRETIEPHSGRYIVGGGVAGAVIGFVVVVASTIVNWNANLQAMRQLQAVNATINEQAMIAQAAGDIIVSVLLTAALAAAGGGIYGAFASSRTAQTPPAAS